jgi:hypothetical protein
MLSQKLQHKRQAQTDRVNIPANDLHRFISSLYLH